jgi:R3H domain
MANPTLSDLIGGIQSVTLGDEEARRRGTQKSILERKAPPTFPVVVELKSWDRVHIHRDVAETVDAILRGFTLSPEIRELAPSGEVRRLSEAEVRSETTETETRELPPVRRNFAQEITPATLPDRAPRTGQRVYPFGISRKRLAQAIRDTGSGAMLSERLDEADVVITDRSYYRRKPLALREAEARGVPIYVLKSNTLLQMQQALISLQGSTGRADPVVDAMAEAEDAINAVMSQDRPVELTPQGAYIRRLQHELAQRFNLNSTSRGKEPQRRVRILPPNGAGGYFPDD